MTEPPGIELASLDLDRLRVCLDEVRPGLVQGDLTASLIVGGLSNLTYRVFDGVSQWVVRRPPLGHVLETAHDMGREYRVISALHGRGVPVPQPVVLVEDADILGAPFYVMEFVEGHVYYSADDLAPLGPARTRAVAEAMVDVLADLHTLDVASVGLGDFGKPDGFLERQVRRWARQLEGSRSREVPGIDELAGELARSVPTDSAPGLVHGDYRIDNLLVDDDDRVAAVVDWEMATLGDTLTDLGLLVVYQRLSRERVLIGDAATAPGYPTEDELLNRYAERSGRGLANMGFYVALASFKLAVILEGIHLRHFQGQTIGTGFDEVGDFVIPLVESGRAALAEGGRHFSASTFAASPLRDEGRLLGGAGLPVKNADGAA